MRRIIALHAWVSVNQQEASALRKAATTPQDDAACKGWHAALPEQYRLIHIDIGKSLKLKALGFQIEGDDYSGGGFNYLAEVAINEPQQPVVLVVNSYYPAVWKIRYAPGTRIAAVWATGYHPQMPIGLPSGVPIVRTSHDKPACRGYGGNSGPMLPHKPERYTIADDTPLQIGEPAAWIDTGDVQATRKKSELLSGTDGIKQLQQQGVLRPLTTGSG